MMPEHVEPFQDIDGAQVPGLDCDTWWLIYFWLCF